MIGYVERARTEFQHLPPLHRNSIRRRGRTGCTSGGKSLWQHTFAVFPGVEDIDFQFVGERENYRRCRCRRDYKKGERRNGREVDSFGFGSKFERKIV